MFEECFICLMFILNSQFLSTVCAINSRYHYFILLIKNVWTNSFMLVIYKLLCHIPYKWLFLDFLFPKSSSVNEKLGRRKVSSSLNSLSLLTASIIFSYANASHYNREGVIISMAYCGSLLLLIARWVLRRQDEASWTNP